MTITLYTQKRCPLCVEAKACLTNAGIQFTTVGMDVEKDSLRKALEAIGLDLAQIKAAPVMIQGDMVWTGADCMVAVECEELDER